MALNAPQITPAEKITVRAISEELSCGDHQRCLQCNILFSLPEINSHQNAHCPHCQAKIRGGRDWSLTRLAAMAFAMLLLMSFAWGEPPSHIWLSGIRIDANVMQDIWQITKRGDTITGAMVFFYATGTPLILASSTAYLWFGNQLGINLRPALLMLERLGEWVMLDIHLVGIGVAPVKVQDYTHIQAGADLFFFMALVILTTVTLSHLSVEEPWERFYPQRSATRKDGKPRACLGCHFTGYPDQRGRYSRYHVPLRLRRRHSLRKCWTALLASIVLLLPANLLPTSIIYLNGGRQEDTVLSGTMSSASSNAAVAGVVFIASILAPLTKVIVMFTLLLGIHFKYQQGLRTRTLLLRVVVWVGHWPILGLSVIFLTISLVNRDQIFTFITGPAAFYFDAAVILTILVVEWLDSRLLWDARESGNARFDD